MNKQINSSTDTNNTVGAAHTRSFNVPMILEASAEGVGRMKIITETKHGSQFPKSVYSVNDDDDFIRRIRETQLHNRSGQELVETVEQAVSYIEEDAVNVQIIDQAEYESTEGWPTKIDEVAERLGWQVQL